MTRIGGFVSGANGLLKFAAYELNVASGELRKGGTPVKLSPQPSKVLVLLASHPGELITREVLRQELWGGETVVDFDQGLNSCIRRLRAALLDDGDQPRYIETVPRRGYRFIAPIEHVSAAAPGRWWLRPILAVGVLAAVAVAVLLARHDDRRPANPEAYAQYRKGHFLTEEFQARPNKRVQFYQDAIAHDPAYAPAYAGLANAYLTDALLNLAPATPQYLTKAKSAALKSLALDPQLGEGHAALACSLWQEWRWPEAEQEYQKAIELSPNDSDARYMFSLFLSSMGRHDEALREGRLAVALDPVSAAANVNFAHDLWMARRYDEAIAESRRVLELHPETRHAYNVLGHCYVQKGMYQEAEAAFREFQPQVPASANLWIAYVRALQGQKQEAEVIIAEARESKSPSGPLAHCYAALGDKSGALERLDEAFSKHSASLLWAKTRPEYDSLRAEPRFIALLRKMGFPP
jgi:DNA-binding winged helix-turn-helix (wHTH) protein/tetratricopeptide (TPR) repeat protein